MHETIETLESDVHESLERDLLPPDVHREVVELANEAEELKHELRRPNAFRTFLHDYLQQQREALAEGDREAPLCRCNYDYCDVSQGRLPGKVRHADNHSQAIDRHIERHPGAVILTEARNEWLQKQSRYRNLVRDAKLKAREGVEQTAGNPNETDEGETPEAEA